MPSYPRLLVEPIDFASIPPRVEAMAALGAPYGEERTAAEALARAQARGIFDRLVAEDATYAGSGLEDRQVVALVAYLLRLGTDITKPVPQAGAAVAEVRP
jgi:cytochrome c oxidase cbb3-type subunit I/II